MDNNKTSLNIKIRVMEDILNMVNKGTTISINKEATMLVDINKVDTMQDTVSRR